MGFDCNDSAIIPLPDPHVREATGVKGTQPDDFQVVLSQQLATDR